MIGRQQSPCLVLTPPALGAIRAMAAPSFSIALHSASTRAASTPSVTSTPILRPLIVGLAFLSKLKVGGFVHIKRLARGRKLVGLAFHTESLLDGAPKRLVDEHQVAQHAGPDGNRLDLAQLERKGADDMSLFGLGHRTEEQACLAVMIGEAVRANAQLVAGFLRGISREAGRGIFARCLRSETVRFVGHAPGGNILSLDAVALKIAHRAARAVDLQLVEVRPTQAEELGVGVGKQPALQQRIV